MPVLPHRPRIAQPHCNCCVDGVHPEATPAQVSRRKRPVVAEDAGSRLVAADRKVTYRPPPLIAAELLAPFACVPLVATDTRWVEGVQPEATPAQVSRTNTSAAPLLSPATRFVAEEMNATYRPSALIDGEMLFPSAGLLLIPLDSRVVEGVHPEETPVHVSRTKIFSMLPGISVTPSAEASTNTA